MLGFSDQYNYDEEFKPESVAHMFVTKAVVSRNPRDDVKGKWVIVAIYGQFRILGFAREGDKVWTDIPCPSRCYDDVVFYEGKFYAVDCHGIVIVCEIDDPKSTVIAPAPVGTRDTIQKYLVESSGDLLLISRERGGRLFEGGIDDEILPRYYTKGFSVLKLEKNNNAGEEEDEAKYEYPFCWIEVKSLGDRALFLGRNPSVSLSASEFEGLFKPNCIYFTDDNEENFYFEPRGGGGLDMGIFNTETSTIEPHFTGEYRSPISPPFWYL
ncbi:hypothetical protein M9H77_11113 [Catharanthus roseus]|uniref:Uncharacterized protein n=1 Tax=Catharanthus roseus TaxID=4058 RepID=A0ACC0BDQ4_CATRO|nr:hypothetical protein M9H77_11113 [Catharanthus roseus]